tara:strand:- start:212331 stop:213008 length:678 start_codon:yes stop_codon:yes gene_type:complete
MDIIVPVPYYEIWDNLPNSIESAKHIKEPPVINSDDDKKVKLRGIDYTAEKLKELLKENLERSSLELDPGLVNLLPEEFIYEAFHNIKSGVVVRADQFLYRRPTVDKRLGNVFNNSKHCLAGYVVGEVLFKKLARMYDGATLIQYKAFAKAYLKLAELCTYQINIILGELNSYPSEKTVVGVIKQTFTDGYQRNIYVDQAWYETTNPTDEQVIEELNRLMEAKTK